MGPNTAKTRLSPLGANLFEAILQVEAYSRGLLRGKGVVNLEVLRPAKCNVSFTFSI